MKKKRVKFNDGGLLQKLRDEACAKPSSELQKRVIKVKLGDPVPASAVLVKIETQQVNEFGKAIYEEERCFYEVFI